MLSELFHPFLNEKGSVFSAKMTFILLVYDVRNPLVQKCAVLPFHSAESPLAARNIGPTKSG